MLDPIPPSPGNSPHNPAARGTPHGDVVVVEAFGEEVAEGVSAVVGGDEGGVAGCVEGVGVVSGAGGGFFLVGDYGGEADCAG